MPRPGRTNQRPANPNSFSQRVKKQLFRFVLKITPVNIENGIILRDLENLYYDEVFDIDPRVTFKFVYWRMLKDKLLHRSFQHSRRILTFNGDKVKSLQDSLLADARAGLSIISSVPRNGQQPKIDTWNQSNTKSSPSQGRGRSRASNFFKDQRVGFQLHELQSVMVLRSKNVADVNRCCTICGISFKNDVLLRSHNLSDIHVFREIYQSCRTDKFSGHDKVPALLSGSAIGLKIECEGGSEGRGTHVRSLLLSNEDMMKSVQAVVNIALVVTLTPTKAAAGSLILQRVFVVHGAGDAIITDSVIKEKVIPGRKIKKNVNVTLGSVGIKDFIVVFVFEQVGKIIFVMKNIRIRVDNEITKEEVVKQDEADAERTPNVEDFVLNAPYAALKPHIVEDGVMPPKSNDRLPNSLALKEYGLPSRYAQLFNSGFKYSPKKKVTPSALKEKENVLETLVAGLTRHNYCKYLQLLLHLEEHQMMYDLRTYSMKNTPIKQDKQDRKLIVVTVPGLAENRPSVIKGDAIYLSVMDSGVFRGYVHRVGSGTLHVGMGSKFMINFIENMKVTVDFTINRRSIRLQHRALELMESTVQIPRICFPTSYGALTKNIPIRSWFNRQVPGNSQQCQAVQNIINGTSKPSPYLLFGPPGTGKTVTVVEAIMQLLSLSEHATILATAPSNSATDLIAERLLVSVPRSQILRLYSPCRDWYSVPVKLQACCNFHNSQVYFPGLKELMKYRVIVTTLICAGRLVSGGFREGHFTHIFVDECGHGIEPASAVPVAGLLGKKGQLVLSGDPKQLGPVIRSPVAKQLGLEHSHLERLMLTCALYQRNGDNGYNPDVLTKLVHNFRSHPDILKVPNELFYDGELVVSGDRSIIQSACEWEELPKKGTALIFHGVEGRDAQDDCSPSFYNTAEIDVVVKYVMKIFDSKFQGQKLRPHDIGVISPYRRQVTKLQRALERKNIHDLSVGSAEEFQGQERRIIIVSTVRSDPAQFSLDRKFRLGFLREPKRFNVAVTRAKALLIVVGNPKILETDPNWRSLLHWSMERGGYTGCHFTASTYELEELQPMDPDEHRVPVKKKLEMQLQVTREALENGSTKGKEVASDYENKLKPHLLPELIDDHCKPEDGFDDIPDEELEKRMKQQLEKMSAIASSLESRTSIAAETIGQYDNLYYLKYKLDYLTSSKFGAVCRRLPFTPAHVLVREILFPKDISHLPGIKFGKENEDAALKKYSEIYNVNVQKCGLIICEEVCYLATSPDGLVGTDSMVEVKCVVIGNMGIIPAVTANKITFLYVEENVLYLKKKHEYFYQIQGQLNITGRSYCDLVVYTTNDIEIIRIKKDKDFWQNEMLPHLQRFYLQCLLPEICDSRIARNQKARDGEYITNARLKKEAK